ELSFSEDIEELRELANQLTGRYGTPVRDRLKGDYFPKMQEPVVGPNGKASLLQWGFPFEGSGRVLFNARGESLQERPAFRPFLGNRCLVPATAFYEWDSKKQKYRFICEGLPVFYMAALWQPVMGKDGERDFRFVIITTAPYGAVEAVHNRMPAIIPRGDFHSWLSGGEITELLKPYEGPMILRKA
ncbi:MAG: SOS response-associated peptidase family protein, partial [Clostridia bacterium]|nr:SOS response-associated peptidase family protein [Clostridia bacterium]